MYLITKWQELFGYTRLYCRKIARSVKIKKKIWQFQNWWLSAKALRLVWEFCKTESCFDKSLHVLMIFLCKLYIAKTYSNLVTMVASWTSSFKSNCLFIDLFAFCFVFVLSCAALFCLVFLIVVCVFILS